MKNRLFAFWALLVVMSLIIAACGPTPEPTKASEAEPTEAEAKPTKAETESTGEEVPPVPELAGTVTLWHSFRPREIEGLNQVVAAFQDKHPNVQFDVLSVPFDDLRGKFETTAAAGGGPSVLVGAADWGPALFDAELIADVRDFTSAPFLASINEAALGAVKYQGALLGLPQSIEGVALFRNTSVITETSATYDDLVAAAQAATQGDTLGANLEYGFFFSAAHLNGIGGQLMDTNGDPLFNDEKGVEWLNLLSSFKDVGPTEYYTDNDVNLFKAGKVGVIIDGSWNMADLAEAIGAENLAIDPWPTYGEEEGHLSGYVRTQNIYLGTNAEGDDKDASWAFMEFFLSPEAQASMAKVGHIPSVVSVEVSNPLMLQAVEAFAAGTAFPVIPEMGAYWDPMDTALRSVFDEGADPAEALQTAYDSITAAIEEIRAGQ